MTKLNAIWPVLFVILRCHICVSCDCDSPHEKYLREDDNLRRFRRSGSDVASSDCDQSQTNMALVVYTPTALSEFREGEKTFTFAGRSITIRQRWEELGVAAVVWDAAVVLAEYLERRVQEGELSLQGRSLVELGAGTGLVGIVSAFLGGDVVVTDRPVALEQLHANVAANVAADCPGKVRVRELTWGEKLEEYPRPFDLVLGADIIYLQETFPALLKTLAHLSDRSTVVLLSCRIRYARDEEFLQAMRALFTVQEVLHDSDRGIHVYRAKLL